MKNAFPHRTIPAILVAAAVACSSCGAPHAMASTVAATAASIAAETNRFALASEAGEGGSLPDSYTCDGAGSTPALAWSHAPAGTVEFAVLMSTVPPDGITKYNWVLYGIPGATRHLSKDSQGVGTLGMGSNGPSLAYQPPCSKGPGPKTYTFTVYALSAAPVLPTGAAVSGATLLRAMSAITLGTATLSLNHTRSNTSANTPPPVPPPGTSNHNLR